MKVVNLKNNVDCTHTRSSVSFFGKRGFTLVEIMVAVSLFSFAMVISMGSIYSVMDANRKSQSLRSVMDNLNSTLESMTRTIRFGTNYHCDINAGIISVPRDCSGAGASSIVVLSSSGTTYVYKLVGGRITRTVGVGGVEQNLTGSDVTITNLTFRVYGSDPYGNGSNLYQPEVIVVISGFVGTKASSKSTFTVQTTISQRLFDSQ